MDAPQPTVLSRASVRNPAETPRSGVVHVNARHTRSFTVIGNHLAQHPELSLVARGLALYIQSVPTGARIGIKELAPLFPESEHRIARALRELEVHGYLRRYRERLPNGRVVTRTVSYNRPGCLPEDAGAPAATPVGAPVPPSAPPVPAAPVRPPVPPPAPASVQQVAAAPAATPAPSLPEPLDRDNPSRRLAAVAVLTELRLRDSRLLLGGQDIERLAPGVEAWLERGAHPAAASTALSVNLPVPLHHPAGLIAHRLVHQLPPAVAAAPVRPAFVPPEPFQTCEECGLAFRSPAPGHCGGCRAA